MRVFLVILLITLMCAKRLSEAAQHRPLEKYVNIEDFAVPRQSYLGQSKLSELTVYGLIRESEAAHFYTAGSQAVPVQIFFMVGLLSRN